MSLLFHELRCHVALRTQLYLRRRPIFIEKSCEAEVCQLDPDPLLIVILLQSLTLAIDKLILLLVVICCCLWFSDRPLEEHVVGFEVAMGDFHGRVQIFQGLDQLLDDVSGFVFGDGLTIEKMGQATALHEVHHAVEVFLALMERVHPHYVLVVRLLQRLNLISQVGQCILVLQNDLLFVDDLHCINFVVALLESGRVHGAKSPRAYLSQEGVLLLNASDILHVELVTVIHDFSERNIFTFFVEQGNALNSKPLTVFAIHQILQDHGLLAFLQSFSPPHKFILVLLTATKHAHIFFFR